MIKSVILVVCNVSFLVINVALLILKPTYSYHENDLENYNVYYEKWIKSTIFMASIIISLISIYFALNLKHLLSLLFIFVVFLLVIIYTICKYKAVMIDNDKIRVTRFLRNDINTTFDNIVRVSYLPNAKLNIKLKSKGSFDVSFNSENFYRLYQDLIKRDVKFKTGRIPENQNHVYLTKYNITVFFPKNMFREYFESDKYFRNSRYLFSARNLEEHEHFEGYYKESNKPMKEFIPLVKNDLKINGFTAIDTDETVIDGYVFSVIKSLDKKNDKNARLAYIYEDYTRDNFFILYADYLLENEEEFVYKIHQSIRRSKYEDGKSRISRV